MGFDQTGHEVSINRRNILKGGAVAALSFMVGGRSVLLSPREARAEGATYQKLTAEEAARIDALGEGLLPGAADAGLSHYIDAQLAGAAKDSFLMIRYLDVPPPWDHFYKAVAKAADAAARSLSGKPLVELDDGERAGLVAGMAAGDIADWHGPPVGLAYFALRSDAVDVVYGTVEGFERLGIPYLAHIEPESAW